MKVNLVSNTVMAFSCQLLHARCTYLCGSQTYILSVETISIPIHFNTVLNRNIHIQPNWPLCWCNILLVPYFKQSVA